MLRKFFLLLLILSISLSLADINGYRHAGSNDASPIEPLRDFSPSDETEPLYHWYNEVTELYSESCSLVYTTVCVTDEHGNYVRDLHLENFNFIDNRDTILPPDIVQLNECPTDSIYVDMVMFFDLSTSMDDEITELRSHISEFIESLSPEINFRLAYWTFNGCPDEGSGSTAGRRDRYRVDFSDPDCDYDRLAPHDWASNAEEAQCLFDAGYHYFYSLPVSDRGSGYEDQYGMLAHAGSTMVFRPEARRIFFLFTDEEPIYNEAECSPSWGPGEGPGSELYDFIDLMNENSIDVFPVTPHDGEMEYVVGLEPASRANYAGYYELADSTNGHWFWLYSDDYGAMVDSIAAVITPEPCCYSFMYRTTASCDSMAELQIDSYDDTWFGTTTEYYHGLCPPSFELVMPEFSGGITTCERQEIAFELNNPYFGLIDTNFVNFLINDVMYSSGDAELSITPTLVSFIPSESFAHGDMVIFQIVSAFNTEGCLGFSPVCTFFVDLMPPECHDPYPAEGETLFTAIDTLGISLSDDFAGVDFDLIGPENISIAVHGDTADFGDIEIIDDRIHIYDVIFPHDGDVTVCVHDIPDHPDYSYCPANLGDCCYEFVLYFSPQTFWFPDTIRPPCDTLLIPIFIDTIGPMVIESASFEISFDPEVCSPIGIVFDSTLTSEWMVDASDIDTETGHLSGSISGPALSPGDAGEFVYIRTAVNCDAWGGDYCPLEIDTMILNGGSPRAIVRDGFLVVDWRWTEWIVQLEILNQTNPDSGLRLAIGGDRYSTDLYDPESDLIILPHIPGFVRAHLAIDDPDYPWVTQLRRDMQDLEPNNRWIIPTFDEPNGIIKWKPHRFPEGKFYLNSIIDMKRDSMALFHEDDTLIIDWITPPFNIDTLCFAPGWNLVSTPVVPPRYEASDVMDFSPVDAYYYNTELKLYEEMEDLQRGKSYWVFAMRDTCIKIGGVELDNYNTNLLPGWNMIGSICDSVDISEICTVPSDAILPGSIYEYDVDEGYYIAAEYLVPGKGYWAMAFERAVLSVPTGGMYCKQMPVGIMPENIGNIIIGDEVLYYTSSQEARNSLDRYDRPIPPSAPESDLMRKATFVRDGFNLDTDIAFTPSWNIRIYEQSTLNFANLPGEYQMMELLDDNGNKTEILSGQNINLEPGNYLLKAASEKVESFQLLGAYPNPFNSSVEISFYTQNSTEISIEIIDANGRLVEKIYEGSSKIGINTVKWHADCPSGNYIYKIISDEDNLIGNLMLVK
ncbi:MAG: T9SS type A sorting domain-containing protein [Candidatus Zixiibacteriota bacterium]